MTTATTTFVERASKDILSDKLPPTREERKVLIKRFVKLSAPLYPGRKAIMDVAIVGTMIVTALAVHHILRK